MLHSINKSLANILYLNEEGIECEELFVDIKDYENHYQVSNLGRVKSIKKYKTTERIFIMSQTVKSNKYLSVMFSKNNIKNRYHVHRLVAEAFIPNPENKPEVNHKDFNVANNNVSNLEWNSRRENFDYSKCNMKIGDLAYNRVVCSDSVLAIRRLHRMNPSVNKAAIARKKGVSSSVVRRIINRETWKHL